jgi:hypothetical protein
MDEFPIEVEFPEPSAPLIDGERAVRIYVRKGSFRATAKELGVSVDELYKLTRTQWWQDEVEELRKEENAIADSVLSEILGTTFEELGKRLAFGDRVVNKQTGEEYVQQVPAAVLVRIMDAVFDKRQLLRNLPTNISEGAKLDELAEKLKELGRGLAARTLESPPRSDPPEIDE